MNDPIALIILFAAIVTVWAVCILAVLLFLTGAKRGRDEYGTRVAADTHERPAPV